MNFPVFDYRADIRNLLVTPQIRARFLRMEPGEVHARHSHDLGHEVFLILEGRCDMEIDGDRAVLGPGQLCVAFAHQRHQARNAGDGQSTTSRSTSSGAIPRSRSTVPVSRPNGSWRGMPRRGYSMIR